MHRQQLANVVAIERDEIGDLFSLGLAQLEPAAGLDLETDVPAWRERDGLARTKHGGCAAHDEMTFLDRGFTPATAGRAFPAGTAPPPGSGCRPSRSSARLGCSRRNSRSASRR